MHGCAPRCFECGKDAHHEHHVVPRVHGGTKTVWLCADCHGLAHAHNMPLPELIKAGIAKARAKNGGGWGVSRSLPYAQIALLHSEGMSSSDISRKLGVKYNSVWTALRRLKKENKA